MTDDVFPLIKRPRGRPPKYPKVQHMEENSLRPPVRDEDPRAAAARRAAELRAHASEIVDVTDKFYIPRDIIPDGWDYQWKTFTIHNQENPTYQVQLAQEGWTAVPAARHPEMMPLGSTTAVILRDGMLLMECPLEIVEERRMAENRRARMQVRAKEEQLSGSPAGTFERDAPRIKKGYSPVQIPD